MDIKSFMNEKEKQKQHNEQENIENTFKKYENLNENQLFDELLKTTNNLRRNGNLTDEQIQNVISVITPHLTIEQQQKLNKIKRNL